MDGIDIAREAAARRRAELDRRLQELHARNSELTSLLMSGGTNRGQLGSSAAQLRRAEELAGQARAHAIEAASRTAEMYSHSADAHERAARLHSLLAETGPAADAAGHRQREQDHLRLAAADRAAAAAVADAHRSPPGGTSAGG